MREFERVFGLGRTTRVVDVGGRAFNWTLVATRPDVLLINVEAQGPDGTLPAVRGDGRRLPFADNCFDVAYSNSVIEHVGDIEDQRAFAAEIRRIAPRYYVQTPNRWFFVEPHLIAPFIHWLPSRITRKLVRHFSVRGWLERPSQASVDALLASIQLLDRAQMAALFPDAMIVEERFLGMAKSIIAMRC